jgi:hypothetical protein
MVWWRVWGHIGGGNPPWMPVLGGQPSWIVTTRIEADVNIYIVIDYYNREHAEIGYDEVAQSLKRPAIYGL